MNFGSNEKLLKKLLILPNKRDSKGKNKEKKKVDTYHKGVYLISRDIDDVCYKMGVAWEPAGCSIG